MTELHLIGLLGQTDKCLKRVHDILESSAVSANGEHGWRQYLDEGGCPGSFGTACGLLAYADAPSARSALLAQVAATIVSKQRADGSWASPTIADGIGLTTATAYSIMALNSCRCPVAPTVFDRAAAWFEQVVQADGATPDCHGHTGYNVTCAAMALRAIAKGHPKLSNRIRQWLTAHHRHGEGWGYAPGSASTVDHTALAIVGLASSGHPADSPELTQALDYIQANYDPNGLQNNSRKDLAYLQAGPSQRQLPYHLFTDGLVGLAYLCMMPHHNLLSDVLKIASRLVATQQPEGHWKHIAVPEKRPTWAIAEATAFLASVRDLLASEGRLIELEQRRIIADRELGSMQMTIRTLQKRTRRLPIALRLLQSWPLHAIWAFLLVFITIRMVLPGSPWVDFSALGVSLLAGVAMVFYGIYKSRRE